jgi:hypothetical protein
MLEILRAIADKVGAKSSDETVDLLSQKTQPEKVVKQIEQREEK